MGRLFIPESLSVPGTIIHKKAYECCKLRSEWYPYGNKGCFGLNRLRHTCKLSACIGACYEFIQNLKVQLLLKRRGKNLPSIF